MSNSKAKVYDGGLQHLGACRSCLDAASKLGDHREVRDDARVLQLMLAHRQLFFFKEKLWTIMFPGFQLERAAMLHAAVQRGLNQADKGPHLPIVPEDQYAQHEEDEVGAICDRAEAPRVVCHPSLDPFDVFLALHLFVALDLLAPRPQAQPTYRRRQVYVLEHR